MILGRMMTILIIHKEITKKKMTVLETYFPFFLESKQLLAKRHILIKIIFFLNQYFLPLGYYFLEGFSALFFPLSKLVHVVYEKSSALPYAAVYIKSFP